MDYLSRVYTSVLFVLHPSTFGHLTRTKAGSTGRTLQIAREMGTHLQGAFER